MLHVTETATAKGQLDHKVEAKWSKGGKGDYNRSLVQEEKELDWNECLRRRCPVLPTRADRDEDVLCKCNTCLIDQSPLTNDLGLVPPHTTLSEGSGPDILRHYPTSLGTGVASQQLQRPRTTG